MNARITPLLAAVSTLVLAAVGACAAHGVNDGNDVPVGGGDAGASGNGNGDGAVGTSPAGDDGGAVTPTEDGGTAMVIDGGPPAMVGGAVDAGNQGNVDGGDAGLPTGDCNVLTDCPYASATGVSGVACANHVCVITCNGDNYDVNGILSDGCEVPNPCPTSAPGGGGASQLCPVEHTQAASTNLGSFDCSDGDSAQDVVAAVPSDDRTHSPAVVSFDGTAGAAPTVLQLYATGSGICENDLNLNLQMNSSAHPTCYSLVADVVGGTTYTCAQTDGSGLCQILNGSGSYPDDSTIYITIAKIDSCPASETDDGAFTLTGHL